MGVNFSEGSLQTYAALRFAPEHGVKFMKALSITTIVLAAFSFLSAVGYIVIGYYASHEQGAHSVNLTSGYIQIVVAAFLAYCGHNAFKRGPASKPLLGISWAIFFGFTVYVITSA